MASTRDLMQDIYFLVKDFRKDVNKLRSAGRCACMGFLLELLEMMLDGYNHMINVLGAITSLVVFFEHLN